MVPGCHQTVFGYHRRGHRCSTSPLAPHGSFCCPSRSLELALSDLIFGSQHSCGHRGTAWWKPAEFADHVVVPPRTRNACTAATSSSVCRCGSCARRRHAFRSAVPLPLSLRRSLDEGLAMCASGSEPACAFTSVWRLLQKPLQQIRGCEKQKLVPVWSLLTAPAAGSANDRHRKHKRVGSQAQTKANFRKESAR